MKLDDLNQLVCPQCGHVLKGEPEGEGSPPTGKSDTDQIRVSFDCPTCEAPLSIVIESALNDVFGANVWVEERPAT